MADPPGTRTLVLFARSDKVIDQIYHGLDPRLTSEQERGGYLPAFAVSPIGSRVMGGEVSEYTEHKEMPEVEFDCIMRAWRIGEEFGYRVRLIDVAKESEFRAWVQRHLHDLKQFPVLLLPDGRRLAGPDEFTEERLKATLKA